MKRIINFCLISALFATSICLGSGSASAADRRDRGYDRDLHGNYLLENIYLAPEVAYVLPTDNDVKSTVFVGARVGYEIDENWAVEIESGWSRYGVEGSIDKDLDINSVPVLGNIRFGQRCEGDDLGWYTFAGAGWAWNDLDENEVGAELDDATLWQVGVGAETQVADHTIAFADVRYLGNTSDISAPPLVTEAIGQDADLNAVFFTLGVKF